MTRYPWVLAVLSLAALPLACTLSVASQGPGGAGAAGVGGGAGTGPGDMCNPVTGAGCAADGSACDLDMNSGFFTCFPPPNTIGVCGVCDGNTATCGPDLTCIEVSGAVTSSCYRYCCTDADCGAESTCDVGLAVSLLNPANPADAVGLCVTSVASDAPACDPPAASPSGGACVGGYPGSLDGGTSDAGGARDDGGAADAGSAADDGGASDGGAAPADGGAAPADGGEPGDAGGDSQDSGLVDGG
jgi:hypothetical protein